MATRELNSQGSVQHYGPREVNDGLGDVISTYGFVRQVELRHDFNQVEAGLPVLNANVDAGTITIPANSIIVRAYYYVETAYVGATATLQLGVQTTAGGTVDADGIDTIAVAALTANAWIVNDGALVGATVGTADVQISIDSAVAAFTAGAGRLVVEYIPTYGN